MDYSQLSDYEINRLVARAIDGLHGDDRTAVDCYLAANIGSAVKTPDGDIGWLTMDFCNNPSDAWPIIADNKIGINPATASDKWAAHYCNWDIAVADENPLRAAMIVFLMMQDAKHANP